MDPAQRDRHFHSCYEVAPKSLINKIFLFYVVATPWWTALPIALESHQFPVYSEKILLMYIKDFIEELPHLADRPAHRLRIFPVSCIFGKGFIDVYKKILLRNYPTDGKWKRFY